MQARSSVCVLVFSIRELSKNRFRDAFGVWNVLQNVFLFLRAPRFMAVCDCDQHNIKIINCETKQLVKTIGSLGSGPQQLDYPYFAAVMPDGKRIAISDFNNDRIQILDVASGMFVKSIGNKQGEATNQFSHPAGIAFLSTGDAVVVDSDNHRLQVVNL